MRSLLALAALTSTALAGPIEPDTLPALNPKPTGKGPAVTLYATKLPVDYLMRMLYFDGNFIMVADQAPFEGRIDKPVPLEAAVGAIGARDKFVVPGAGPAATIDAAFYKAPVKDLMRVFADTIRVDLIWAPSKPPPDVTLRLMRVDARIAARAVIKLSGLELIERNATWIVVDQGTALDPKLTAKTFPTTLRLRARAAMPGELEQLLDPNAPAGKCPKDRTIDASVRAGKFGLVLAVAATIPGPPCDVAPGGTKPGTLVATLSGSKDARALFRDAKGTQIVKPGAGDEVGDGWIRLGADAIQLYPSSLGGESPIFGEDTTPCGAEAAKVGYALRATAKVGPAWRALLLGKDGTVRILTEKERSGKVAISAGRVVCEKGATYPLTSP